MIFQGKELHIGDKLVSKRKGEVLVSHIVDDAIIQAFVPCGRATAPAEWDAKGRYCLFEKDGVDLRWPDPSPEQPPSPIQALHDRIIDFMDSCKPLSPDIQREAEYRRVWIECAMRLYCVPGFPGSGSFILEKCFTCADKFIAELKKRDGGNNGAD